MKVRLLAGFWRPIALLLCLIVMVIAFAQLQLCVCQLGLMPPVHFSQCAYSEELMMKVQSKSVANAILFCLVYVSSIKGDSNSYLPYPRG
jgi:hypothetical protein